MFERPQVSACIIIDYLKITNGYKVQSTKDHSMVLGNPEVDPCLLAFWSTNTQTSLVEFVFGV